MANALEPTGVTGPSDAEELAAARHATAKALAITESAAGAVLDHFDPTQIQRLVAGAKQSDVALRRAQIKAGLAWNWAEIAIGQARDATAAVAQLAAAAAPAPDSNTQSAAPAPAAAVPDPAAGTGPEGA